MTCVIALLAVVGAASIAGTGSQPVSAADLPGAITGITTTTEKVDKWDIVHFSCTWAVPDDAQPGDTFTLELPSELKWWGDTSFPLNDPDGNKVADATVVDDGTTSVVTFELTDFVLTHDGVHGGCEFVTQYIVDEPEITELVFQVGAEEVRVPITQNPPCTEDCDGGASEPAKYMWWTTSSQTRLQVSIVAPKTTEQQTTVVMEDDPGAGMELDCLTVEAHVGTNLDGTAVVEPNEDATHPATVECGLDPLSGEIRLKVTWTDLPAGLATQVLVQANITDPSLPAYQNDGTVTMNGRSASVGDDAKRENASGNASGTPTTTTTTAPTSTTAAPTTSTTSTTTTAAPTTSTTAPTSTSTTSPTVPTSTSSTSTTIATSSSIPPTSGPDASSQTRVLGRTATFRPSRTASSPTETYTYSSSSSSSKGRLARTGSDSLQMAGLAFSLLVVGTVLVAVSRRRETT